MDFMPLNTKLFREIQKAILEEPKRIFMSAWCLPLKEVPKAQRPSCGTIACIAGWACIFGGKAKDGKTLGKLWIPVVARDLLGIDQNQSAKLFHVGDWPSEWRSKLWAVDSGTRAYAKVVADYIGHFVKQEKQVEKQVEKQEG